MTDIVERLRASAKNSEERGWLTHAVMDREAADVIERLTAALAFYARPIAYQGDNVRNEGQDDPFTPPDRPYIQSVGRDGGEVARRGLEKKP